MPFRIHPEQFAIRFVERVSRARWRAAAEACCLAPWEEREELPGEDFSILGVMPGERRGHALDRLHHHPHVAEVRPVFRGGPSRWLATDRVLVSPRAGGAAALRRLVRAGATILEERHGTVLLRIAADQNVDHVLRGLRRHAAFGFAEPDHVILGHLHASNARLAVAQAPLRLIDAAAGWKAGVATKRVVIAVLDCGVMPGHPDLEAALTNTFDATSGRRNQSPPPWDTHGTSCAGLAAGTHAGADGVRGVADGCGLMGVRVGRTPTRLGTYITKTSWLCRGIDWAWEHGAAVLSMSFGGGPRSAAVTAALGRARTRGRKGKGAVLVASAGNGDAARTPVEFPATLSWVLAVSATDDHDRPKRAPTNQEPWVSASGPAVDIAAPGVGCYTTTVPDPTEGEPALYTTDFSGTSASTPLVAGAAALLIGVNPALSERQVRGLLCASADKVRTVTWRNGRNDWVGSGRLNVGAAIRAARKPASG